MKSIHDTSGRYDGRFHLERVCFERIFDAPARTGHFSFEAAGKRQYGVMLPEGDVPRAGSQYAVALAEKDNWQTIVAWRDLSTPDVCIRETPWQVVGEYAWLAWFGMPIVLGMTFLSFGPWAMLAVLALAVWGGAAYLRRVIRRTRALGQVLRDVPPQVPPGAGRSRQASWRMRVGSAVSSLLGFWRV